jgi:outer membrane protein OmpA-like peptidoglycan-associated protein/tetratricopeptide (TPR) repeat protein
MTKKLLILIIAIAGVLPLKAQNIALSKADHYFQIYAYSEAANIYEKLYSRNPDNQYLIQQLAYCYQKMEMYQKALHFYELHLQGKRVRNEDYYSYASLLLIEGQFEKATEWFKKYMELVPGDPRPVAQIERIAGFAQLNFMHLVDSVTLESFNTRFSDMAPMFFHDDIAFVSARDSSGGTTYSWNDQPFLDIYQPVLNKKGEKVYEKMPDVNTKYHEGPMAFSNNFQTIWITRNDQSVDKNNQEQTNNLKIYTFDWNGKKWKNEREFQYNSNEYSVGHPAFSPDGKTMYFASNMPGSIGETDIFKVSRIEVEDADGNKLATDKWSAPVNLGKQINTKGKEMFPYVDSRGVLFFASDGLGGFGGLDIYAAFPVADSFNVMNLGQPINSTYDDFGLIVSDDFSHGYFTSNRSNGVGSDDIYSFKIGTQILTLRVKSLEEGIPVKGCSITTAIDGKTTTIGTTDENGDLAFAIDFKKKYLFNADHPSYIANKDSLLPYEIFKLGDHSKTIYIGNTSMLEGLVVNNENGDPISGVTVLIDFEKTHDQMLTTDATGKIRMVLKQPDVAHIKIEKSGYLSVETTIRVNKIGESNFSFTGRIDPIYEGKTIVLENLYYDVNSAEIRKDAAIILDELVRIMNENPTMKIELSSHTDSRAPADYNLKLSQQRADAAVNYLISRGVKENRLVAKGYGEKKLLNKCADGVDCPEEEHQKNRRTEFKILEL